MSSAFDPSGFADVTTLTAVQRALDERGLRATGSPAHDDYVDDLERRLRASGVASVWREPIPMRRWTPRGWSLHVDGETVQVLSPVAYSRLTGPDGVRGTLATEPAPGVIGVADVEVPAVPAAVFDALDWDAPHLPVHGPDHDPHQPYRRVSFSQDSMRAALDRFAAAGAAAAVLVVDLPAAHLPGGYLLYDGVHRGIPALFVAREAGPALHAGAAAGSEAVLVLEADVEDTTTDNLLGLVPGASEELVVLHSHTDGPNGIEDNGPEAIVAMAEHLARGSRPERGVLVLLSTGHFALEEAWGTREFLAAHAEDLVPRIAAVLTIEHLGALVGRPDREEGAESGAFEFGAFFASPHRAVIDVARAALDRAAVTESRVLRPFTPDATGLSPDGKTWPGDGCAFWQLAGLPAANFITGPDYLFTVEPVASFIDVEALRRQAIAFTEAVLALCAVPRERLTTRPTTVDQPA